MTQSDKATANGVCPDLEHQDPIRHDEAQQALTAEEAAAIRMLAEIFVDAMMRLKETLGLTPKRMCDYYTGGLQLGEKEEETR